MEKENNQAAELQKLVDTWSAMQKYAFYVGTQRGVLSAINTLCLRFAGLTFEEYTKKMIKPQLNNMLSVGQAIQLLAGLLSSINELINAAMADAKQELEQEKGENNEKEITCTIGLCMPRSRTSCSMRRRWSTAGCY